LSADPDPFRIIANLTHELKTPLHSILSVASIMAAETDGPLTEEQKKQVSIIQRNGDHLLEMITDLLSYASVSSRTRKIKIEASDPSELVTRLLQEITPLAHKKQIDIEMDTSGCPGEFYTDTSLLSKIANNLIGNAIKFTPEGGKIFVSLSEGSGNSLIFSVVDSGIGMDAVSREKLFSAFYQADSSSTRQYGGVGLGLALVKYAVEELEGKIEVQSEAGQGSSFTITLPDLSGRAQVYGIVVCEQDETIRSALVMLLEKEGYRVAVSSREELSRVVAEMPADLLLFELSSADALEHSAVRVIKEEVLSGAAIPIIGMLTSSRPQDRSKAIQAGLDDIISKPFDTSELLNRIRLILDKEDE
jgi:CheY-like chemotaxis protein